MKKSIFKEFYDLEINFPYTHIPIYVILEIFMGVKENFME